MSNYRCVDFQDLCRICTANAEDRINIFSNDGIQKNLNAIIAECLSLHIDEKDRLPKVVCQHCVEQVEQIYEFRNVCKNSQKMLNDCLNTATQQNGGKVYIKDAIAAISGKSLSVVGTTSVPQLSGVSFAPQDTNQAVSSQCNDILHTIMQAAGIQQQQQQQAQPTTVDKPLIQQYTITLDSKSGKTDQVEYKVESAADTFQQMQQHQQQPALTTKEVEHNPFKELLKTKPNIKVRPVRKDSQKQHQPAQPVQQQIPQQFQSQSMIASQEHQQQQQQQQQQLQNSVATICLQQLQQQIQQQQLQQLTSQLQPQQITIATSAPNVTMTAPSEELSPSKSKKPKLNFVLTPPNANQALSTTATLQQPQIQLQLLPTGGAALTTTAHHSQSTATLLSNLLQQTQQLQQPAATLAAPTLLSSPNKCYLPITIKDEHSDQQIVAHIDAKTLMMPTYQLQMKLQPQIATADGQPLMQLPPTSIPATLQLTPQALANQTLQALATNGSSALITQQQILKPNVQITSQQILKAVGGASSCGLNMSTTNDAATSTNDPLEDFTAITGDGKKTFQQQEHLNPNNNNTSGVTIKQQKYRLTQHPGSNTIEIMPKTDMTQQIMQQVQRQQRQRQQQLAQQQMLQASNSIATSTTSTTTTTVPTQHGGITVQRITAKQATAPAKSTQQAQQQQQQQMLAMQPKLPVLNKNNVTISRVTSTQQHQQQQPQQQQQLATKLPQKLKAQIVTAVGEPPVGGSLQQQQQEQSQRVKALPTKKPARKPIKTEQTPLATQASSQPSSLQVQLPPQQQLLPTVDNVNNAEMVQQQAAPASTNGLKCNQCERVFKKKEHLTQHVKLHAGLRPFKCAQENCGKSFSRKEHLLRHEVSHTGRKQFICDVCQKPFSRKDNLNKHRRIHTGQANASNYMCNICNKSFAVKSYYQQHKQMHEKSPNKVAGTPIKTENDNTDSSGNVSKTNVAMERSQPAQQVQTLATISLPTQQQPPPQQQQQPQQQQFQITQQQLQQLPQQQQIMHLQLPSVVTTQDLAGNTITITQTHDPSLKATLSNPDGSLIDRVSLQNFLNQAHFVNPTTGQIMGRIKIEK